MTDDKKIDYDEVSRKIIDEIVKISFRQFVQKIEVGVEDVAKTVIDEFRDESLHAILETIVFYRSISKDEGFLFPDGTRFLFNRGSSKIVAIEQKPQVRTLALDESLWGSRRDQRGDIKNFSLAFPYVIFIAVFSEKVESIYVYFRNKPLKSLNSTLRKAVFSNLNADNGVCRSESNTTSSMPLNVRIETAIADFWQSTFNSDLDNEWRERTDIDNRLDLNAWRLQSQADPLFPCSIEWKKSKTLGEAMEVASTNRDLTDGGSDDKVSQKLTEMMNVASDEVSEKLKKYISTERLDRLCPRGVEKELSGIVGNMCGEMETMIRKLVIELGAARERIDRQSTDVCWETESKGQWG